MQHSGIPPTQLARNHLKSHYREPAEESKSKHQVILFLVDHVEWPTFAVELDYTFSGRDVRGILFPQELKCCAAFVEKGETLAGIIARERGSGNSIETALYWRDFLT
jgi:hypothetical protein